MGSSSIMQRVRIQKWADENFFFTRYTVAPMPAHISNRRIMLSINTINQSVKNAGRPLFSPIMATMSAKTTKKIQRSRAGAKKTNSARRMGKGKIKMWKKMSTKAHAKTPS